MQTNRMFLLRKCVAISTLVLQCDIRTDCSQKKLARRHCDLMMFLCKLHFPYCSTSAPSPLLFTLLFAALTCTCVIYIILRQSLYLRTPVLECSATRGSFKIGRINSALCKTTSNIRSIFPTLLFFLPP